MIFRGLARGPSRVKGAGSHLGNLHLAAHFLSTLIILLHWDKEKKNDKHGSVGVLLFMIDRKYIPEDHT